jgi:hypothetical protein
LCDCSGIEAAQVDASGRPQISEVLNRQINAALADPGFKAWISVAGGYNRVP